jgi:hypothetical protein
MEKGGPGLVVTIFVIFFCYASVLCSDIILTHNVSDVIGLRSNIFHMIPLTDFLISICSSLRLCIFYDNATVRGTLLHYMGFIVTLLFYSNTNAHLS